MSEEMRRDDPLLPEESEPGEPLSQEGESKKEEKESSSDDLFYWLNALTTALVCLVLVFTFFGRLTRVDGHSMVPTLQNGDKLIVWGAGYEPSGAMWSSWTATQPTVSRWSSVSLPRAAMW